MGILAPTIPSAACLKSRMKYVGRYTSESGSILTLCASGHGHGNGDAPHSFASSSVKEEASLRSRGHNQDSVSYWLRVNENG